MRTVNSSGVLLVQVGGDVSVRVNMEIEPTTTGFLDSRSLVGPDLKYMYIIERYNSELVQRGVR